MNTIFYCFFIFHYVHFITGNEKVEINVFANFHAYSHSSTTSTKMVWDIHEMECAVFNINIIYS